jgi:hypothetical protein
MTESSSVPVPGRYQHMFWFALLLATAVMLASASIAVGAYQGAGDPATVVRSYFAAVAAGDAAGALGYGDLPTGRHDLLTADVLAAQNAVAPISDLVVLRVQHGGANLASVEIGYTLDFASGPTITVDTVALARHGHDWRLAQSAVPEHVSPGNGSTLATFAGAAVPTGDYAMFPGAVPITYHTPNLEADSSSRVVRFAGTGSMEVNAQVTAAGRRAIAPAVNAALAACLAGKGAPQALCPVPDPETAVPGSLRGRTTGKAGVGLQLIVTSSDGEIDISEEATVSGTYQSLDENNLASAVTVKSVGLRAHSFATAPGKIVWATS